MSHIDSIRDGLNEIIRLNQQSTNLDNPYLVIGKVTEVAGDRKTCTVKPLDPNRDTLYDVLLVSDTNGGPTYVPSVNTIVTVNLYSSNSGYIAQHGAVSQVVIASGTKDYGGFVIVQNATDKFNALEDKVNALIDFIKNHIDTFNAHTHAVSGTVASPTTPGDIQPQEQHIQKTQKADLENIAATHGNGVQDDTATAQKRKSYEDQLASLNSQLNISYNQQQLNYQKLNDAITPVEKGAIQKEIDLLDKEKSRIDKEIEDVTKKLNELNK